MVRCSSLRLTLHTILVTCPLVTEAPSRHLMFIIIEKMGGNEKHVRSVSCNESMLVLAA